MKYGQGVYYQANDSIEEGYWGLEYRSGFGKEYD